MNKYCEETATEL